MTDSPLVLGIDLGTSGIRTAVVAANGAVLDSRSQAYGGDFANPHSWREGCGNLIRAIPAQLRSQLQALAVDGTSGTLLACDRDGSPLGEALAYSQSCPELQSALQPLVDPGSPAASCSGSLLAAPQLPWPGLAAPQLPWRGDLPGLGSDQASGRLDQRMAAERLALGRRRQQPCVWVGI